MSEKICPQCGKVSHASRVTANRVARKLGNKTYWSEQCRAWHTATSGSWTRVDRRRKKKPRRHQKRQEGS
jgi:hypothetical protein